MIIRLLVTAGLVLAVFAMPAAAQEPPNVRSGSLATIPVQLPEKVASGVSDGDPVTYTVQPAAGFRLVGAPERELDYRPGDLPLVPVTISVPGDAVAGLQEVALLVFRSGESVDSARAMLTVEANTSLQLSLAANDPEARPGSRLNLKYEITNNGNRADTVLLVLNTRLGEHDLDEAPVIVEPFSTVFGSIELEVSDGARPGTSDVLLLQASGTDELAFDQLEIPVTRPSGVLDGLVQVPASIFVGSTLSQTNASPVVAFEAGGRIRPQTTVLIQAHHVDHQSSGFAFRGLQFGPKFRAQLISPTLAATVGDLFTRISPMAGYALAGRGAEASVGFGRFRVGGHVARPLDPAGDVVGGSQFAGGVDLATRLGTFGVHALSERREDQLLVPNTQVRTGLLRFGSRPQSRHQIEAEAGYMALANFDTGEDDAGLAASGRYAYRGRTMSADLNGRWRPSVRGDRGLAPREFRAAASIQAFSNGGFSGQSYYVQNPASPLLPLESAAAAELGVFFATGQTRLDLRGRIRRSESLLTVVDRTIEAAYSGGLGNGTLDARAEAGFTSTAGSSRRITRLRGGYSLRSSAGWGRIGLTYFDDVLTPGALSVEFSGSYRFNRLLEVYGTLANSLTRFDFRENLLVRAGAQWNLSRSLSVYTALESLQSQLGDGVRFSVGVRKGLPMPLPVPRQSAVHGIVFEDVNGNGRFDAEEPMVDGVRLLMGSERAASRAGGRFEFLSDVARGMVEIEPSSLGDGFLPQAPRIVPSSGRMEIALHRPASIRAVAYLDLNGNEVWDQTEPPVRDAELLVTGDEDASWMLRTGGDGSVELNSIRPGKYVISIDPSSLPRRAQAAKLHAVELVGGQGVNIAIPVPTRRVEMRRVAEDEGAPADSVAEPEEMLAVGAGGAESENAAVVEPAPVPTLDAEPKAELVGLSPDATPLRQPATDALTETLARVVVEETPVLPISPDALAPSQPIEPEFLGALRVETFYDANGNGIRDQGEEDAAGVQVTITRGEEEWRFRTGIDGTTDLTPVPVGIYIVSAFSRAFADLGAQPGIFPIRVESVRQTVIRLPVPVRVDRFMADDDDDD